MLDQLKTKLKEKQEYLENLKIEINACAGQIILLQELIKAEEEKPKNG